MSKKNHDQFKRKKFEREATLIKTKKRACLGLEKKKKKTNKTKQKQKRCPKQNINKR